MAELSKGDLQYRYSWTAISGDDPEVSGEPDRTLFNRNEGYEVLYLLNKYAEMRNLTSKGSILELEEFIQKELPRGRMTQENVIGFIDQHLGGFRLRKTGK